MATFHINRIGPLERRTIMLIGYARVSTQDQNLDRQLDILKVAGCEKVYQEKITGTTKERPELKKLLENIRSGDTIIISDLTRLSRSTKDLFDLVDSVHGKGADIKSLKESWLDTTTATGKLMFTIMAGLSQFERDFISQRTKEGLESARVRGRKGGRPSKENKKIRLALKMYNGNEIYSIPQIVEATGISKTTLYRYINSEKLQEGN